MQLDVVEGDIAALEVDAIANAANDRLWMGAGVAGALKRAGGEEIEREAVAKGPIGLGEAVATGAGRLKASHVIHGAVMGQDLRTNAELVRRTTRTCLELADELGARSLALPAFGTGVGGFPLAECARIMVEEVRDHEPGSLERVVFAVFGDEARHEFENALAAVSNARGVDRSFQTDARAEPTRPEGGIASDASAETAHELAEAIASAEAVPASGWVTGVAAGLAAALVAKTAARSEGWGAAEGARAQALDLRDRLLALAGQDARAYEHALTALERRDSGLARALSRAAEVPLAIAETSVDVALLAAEAAEAADGSARADASAAAALAAGAVRAAARLVEVNLVTLEDDERLARASRAVEAGDDAAKRALAVEP